MEARVAGEFIDACRADVKAAISEMRQLKCTEDVYQSVHEIISVYLNQRLRLLRYHRPNATVLPEELHAAIGRRKAEMTLADFELVIRLRTSQWRNSMTELVARLERDWPKLVQQFDLDPNAALTAFSEPLGDPHHDGRAVCKLTFDDGSALIYKPRSIGTEQAFGRMIEWLQQTDCEPDLRWCRTLSCEGYGWSEYVPQTYCETREDAERYYQRQGAFLALFFLLRGSDCIAENVVGQGEHPVWVDVECMCRPKFEEEEPLPPEYQSVPWIRRSVLASALMFYANVDGFTPRGITALNDSCLEDRSAVFTQEGILRDPYVAAVQRGFRAIYERALAQPAAWSANGSVLAYWHGQRVRLLARSTAFYGAVAGVLSIAPPDERAQARQTVEDLLLARSQGTSFLQRLVPIELEVLGRLDVPHWTIATDSRHLREASGGVVQNVAWQPPMASLAEHLSQISEKELATQLWLIDGYLRLRLADPARAASPNGVESAPVIG